MSGERDPLSRKGPKHRPDPGLPPPPWSLVLVRYCPACRLDHTPGADRCSRCGGALVDREKRIEVEDR